MSQTDPKDSLGKETLQDKQRLTSSHFHFFPLSYKVGDDVEQDLGGGAVELGLERILGKFWTCFEVKSFNDSH